MKLYEFQAKERKRGKILSIDREAKRLTVEGLRLVKKHVKKGRDRANPDGRAIVVTDGVLLGMGSLGRPTEDLLHLLSRVRALRHRPEPYQRDREPAA